MAGVLQRTYASAEDALTALRAAHALGLNCTLVCRKASDTYRSGDAGLRHVGAAYAWTLTIDRTGPPWAATSEEG